MWKSWQVGMANLSEALLVSRLKLLFPDVGSLTKGSLNVQDYFNDPNFIADSVIVVTYDSVVEEGESDPLVIQLHVERH